jgi:adenine-specific DNA-methyltransferase
MTPATIYIPRKHAAVYTDDFVFSQLIPYIGNKRKLLGLIQRALALTAPCEQPIFLDLFAGSGVVSRLAKVLKFQVISNDWEPYAKVINNCYIANNNAPHFTELGGYDAAVSKLNSLPSQIDWITEHLCPRDDTDYDTEVDRMFYMRKNGMRIDAIRNQIQQWKNTGAINQNEEDCLLAPLLYQTCYVSNTSGVFKGFHNGWGGQTHTALNRIASDLTIRPAVFYDNKRMNQVLCDDAERVAKQLSGDEVCFAYLDPPYNQHPYGSNYHVLNTVALWDKPELSKIITKGTKSAIREDWRTQRRSAYNHAGEAVQAYQQLVQSLNAHYILTSYSTDGTMPLDKLLEINVLRGHVDVVMENYKRYRVSSQRFSERAMDVEFVVITDTHRQSDVSVDELSDAIHEKEVT